MGEMIGDQVRSVHIYHLLYVKKLQAHTHTIVYAHTDSQFCLSSNVLEVMQKQQLSSAQLFHCLQNSVSIRKLIVSKMISPAPSAA